MFLHFQYVSKNIYLFNKPDMKHFITPVCSQSMKNLKLINLIHYGWF